MRLAVTILCLLSWGLASIARADRDSLDFGEEGSSKRSRARLARSEASEMPRFESKAAARRSDYMYYLPFGTGQFLEKKTWLGTGLAATQGSLLLLYYSRISEIKETNADADSVMKATAPQGMSGNTTLLMYMDQNEKAAREARNAAQMYLVAFMGIYALGVVDAIYDPFKTSSIDLIRRDRRGRAKGGRSRSESFTREDKKKNKKRFSVIVTPEKSPSYGMSMATDF